MIILLWVIALFTIFLVIHIIVWKISLPGRPLAVLGQLCLVIFILWVAGVLIPQVSRTANPIDMIGGPEIFRVGLCYICLCLIYIEAYTTIAADSPSIKTMMVLYNAEPDGLDRDELLKGLQMERYYEARLDHLLKNQMVVVVSDKYVITSKGRRLMETVVLVRKILELPITIG